jgi:hypothetical protein
VLKCTSSITDAIEAGDAAAWSCAQQVCEYMRGRVSANVIKTVGKNAGPELGCHVGAHALVLVQEDTKTHIIAQDMRYGFLTYLNGTFFIKRVGQDEYAFTDAIQADGEDLTLLEMLLCEQGWNCSCELNEATLGSQPASANALLLQL